MRKLKFRGIATVNDKHNGIKVGDFVYGCFVETNIDCQILFGDGEQVSVDRKTVGQYTGLADKNGVEIYEGDITKREIARHWWLSVISSNSGFQCNNLYAMEFCNNVTVCELEDIYTFKRQPSSRRSNIHSELTVIGNIHKNPELLGEQK